MIRIIFISVFVVLFAGFTTCCRAEKDQHCIRIQWADKITGDFSFTEHWSYPEGVFRNVFGQLSCDGICPPEIERMKDQDGRILEDSLDAFYHLVDTTHLFHSICSEARTYEWAGTDFILAEKISPDTVQCVTLCNAGTHSSLHLLITANEVIPTIELNSVAHSETEIYLCSGGTMTIDKNQWAAGILKANFDFTFEHNESPDEPMYWKGKIYVPIDKLKN